MKADQFVEAIYKSLTQAKRAGSVAMKQFVLFTVYFRSRLQSASMHKDPARCPATGKAAAPVDLTGYWVSVVTEDWRWRMVTPLKGDAASIPINAEARKIVDAWDPAKDEAAGLQCKAYGAPAVMRIPGRLHITWQDDNTLKIETDAGTQTRLLHFDGQAPAHAQPSWQGYSAARWIPQEAPGGGLGLRRAANPPRSLEVVTTELRPGLSSQERSAVQRQNDIDRILRPVHGTWGRRLVHRNDNRH